MMEVYKATNDITKLSSVKKSKKKQAQKYHLPQINSQSYIRLIKTFRIKHFMKSHQSWVVRRGREFWTMGPEKDHKHMSNFSHQFKKILAETFKKFSIAYIKNIKVNINQNKFILRFPHSHPINLAHCYHTDLSKSEHLLY